MAKRRRHRGTASGGAKRASDQRRAEHDADDQDLGGHLGAGFEVRRIQPYQAVKTYRCPGCDHEIRPGTGHVVVVPTDAPDLRRHWHTPCWRHDRDHRAR